MKPHWILAEPQKSSRDGLSQLDVHPALFSMLQRRGIQEPVDIQNFLNPSLKNLKDPQGLSDMAKAVKRIKDAVSRKEKVLIYGDYDVDGLTSTAILYLTLKKMGLEGYAYIPHRLNDGYGVNGGVLEKWIKKKIDLVITVDNGMTAVKEVQFLLDKKIDTIIVDHHIPKNGLPAAYAIVAEAIEEGDDKSTHLAACGLVFKLAWGLLGSFEEAREFLDLVALGTVADIAPVVGDNRILLKFGLEALAQTKRAGLKELMRCAGLSPGKMTYRDVAFGLGPRINASGRMGSAEDAFKLLITNNSTEAQNLAQILDDGNRDRQKVEAEAFEEAIEMIERDPLKDEVGIYVLHHDRWHEGVVGIVASRITQRYQRPSIVISLKNGIGKGSGRSIPSFSLFDTVLKCEDLLNSFGGHSQACGLTIEERQLPLFKNRLKSILAADGDKLNLKTPLMIESELSLSELDISFLEELARLEPFGPGNERPLFLSKNIHLKSQPKKRGRDTLQAWISDMRGLVTCEAIAFRAYEKWACDTEQSFASIVYQPCLRNYNGITSIQLELEDWC